MTLPARLESALQSAWLPLALLLLGLSTVFIFGGDRGHFYRWGFHNWMSSLHLTVAVNLSPEHGFQRFSVPFTDEDGAVRYSQPYNKFPIGGYAGMKLATLPFGGSPPAQLTAARILMLLSFASAALIAYLSLCRLSSNRWIALTATLLAFSSYYLLYYNDMTANEGMPDLFGVLLTFHGMVVFVQEGRFRQLLVKACIALLLGWHVLALLLPFVIFGLARDLLRARSAPQLLPPSSLSQVKHAAATLIRSRYLLLGIAALGFGLSILTFNFAMEYAALNGETPLTELPSFQSMLRRTGADSDHSAAAAARDWSSFLEGQFSRISRMFIPYALLGVVAMAESPTWLSKRAVAESPTWLPKRTVVVLGVALSVAGLIGSIFVRPRILFATLASFGFFWALPMRNQVVEHSFESIYYIGVPLAFFTIALLLARRLIDRDAVIAAASIAALILFAVSSFQVSRIGYSAESAQAVRAAEQELLAVPELTKDELVTVLYIGGQHKPLFGNAEYAVEYYLNTILIRYSYLPAAEDGFVVMRERVDTDALLTPQNQYFFLYDTAGLTAWYQSKYQSVAATEPLARKEFDVHLIDSTVYYLKEPCERTNAAGRFFLHVYPEDLNDISDHRRQHRFDNLDFGFEERGLLFDGKCLASVDLPQYDIARFRTGRIGVDGSQGWSAAPDIQGPKLISAYQSIVSTEPAARSEFDLYLDGGKLYYLKAPCGSEDVQARFFLHLVPESVDDLPEDRREHGFDNLDFGFEDRGLAFDGKCAAAAPLPQYGIARIITGQFDGDGRIWGVEFAPDARE